MFSKSMISHREIVPFFLKQNSHKIYFRVRRYSHIGCHFGCLDFLCLQLVDLHISKAFRHETLQIQLSWVFLNATTIATLHSPYFLILQITFGFSNFQSFKTHFRNTILKSARNYAIFLGT